MSDELQDLQNEVAALNKRLDAQQAEHLEALRVLGRWIKSLAANDVDAVSAAAYAAASVVSGNSEHRAKFTAITNRLEDFKRDAEAKIVTDIERPEQHG